MSAKRLKILLKKALLNSERLFANVDYMGLDLPVPRRGIKPAGRINSPLQVRAEGYEKRRVFPVASHKNLYEMG